MNTKTVLSMLLAGTLALFITGVLLQLPSPIEPNNRNVPGQLSEAKVVETYGQLPLYFIENQGQVDGRVAYYVAGKDKTLYFTAQGITIALTGRAIQDTASDALGQTVSRRPFDF